MFTQRLIKNEETMNNNLYVFLNIITPKNFYDQDPSVSLRVAIYKSTSESNATQIFLNTVQTMNTNKYTVYNLFY